MSSLFRSSAVMCEVSTFPLISAITSLAASRVFEEGGWYIFCRCVIYYFVMAVGRGGATPVISWSECGWHKWLFLPRLLAGVMIIVPCNNSGHHKISEAWQVLSKWVQYSLMLHMRGQGWVFWEKLWAEILYLFVNYFFSVCARKNSTNIITKTAVICLL